LPVLRRLCNQILNGCGYQNFCNLAVFVLTEMT
jgi:hypothetical protein